MSIGQQVPVASQDPAAYAQCIKAIAWDIMDNLYAIFPNTRVGHWPADGIIDVARHVTVGCNVAVGIFTVAERFTYARMRRELLGERDRVFLPVFAVKRGEPYGIFD